MSESMTNLFRLLYVSQSLQRIRHSDVQAILRVSQRNNRRNGITGVLCIGTGMFMQVLEGPEQKVIATYAGIIEDPRHTRCGIVNAVPAKARLFDEWAMGYIKTEAEAPRLMDYALSVREAATSQDRTISMMRDLVKALRKQEPLTLENAKDVVLLDDAETAR